MSSSPLISARELESRLGDDRLRIFDCRFSLKDPRWGIRQYLEHHIEGAIYAHLDDNLSHLETPHAGRHPLPDEGVFRRWMESVGVSDPSAVVCYDDAGGAIAARLWWMARWIGLADVRLLDGGLDAWRAAGYPLDSKIPEYTSGTITTRSEGDWICEIDEVSKVATGGSDLVLLDAREAARYVGDVEPLDPVAGHIPGALNAPYSDNLDDDKRFLSVGALRQRFATLADGANCRRVVHMCGSGVTACHNLLAMEAAGLAGSRLFPGSWSQWVDDVDRPVATGKEARGG